MQDFTKNTNRKTDAEILANKVDREKAESIESEVTPDLIFKIDADFIKARMNKDNSWNLVFWLGTSLTILIAEILAGLIPKGGGLLLAAAIILTPYFLAKINKVEVIEDKIRTTSGRVIPEKLPQSSGALFLLTFIAIVFWIVGSMAFGYKELDFVNINFALWNMILWFPTMMYFILKNYPVNMFFNKATWAAEIISEESTRRKSRSSASITEYMYDPSYRWHPMSIYRRR